METLKKMRDKKKITYKEMAEILNISKAYYWQIENEKRRLSYSMAVKIADVFKTTPDKIFYEDFKKQGL